MIKKFEIIIHRVLRGKHVGGYGYKAITECGVVIEEDTRVSRYWRRVDCEDCVKTRDRKYWPTDERDNAG